MEISSNLTLELSDEPFLLEKRIELLHAIKKEGSISKAAKVVPMSYKSAWEAINAMNNLSLTPIVLKETGGSGGGGTKLTAYGKNLLKTYALLKTEQEIFLEKMAKITDMDSGTLKMIGRLSMQISARNQISGIVDKIINGDVNANIVMIPKNGQELFANVSQSSVDNLGIKEGDEIIAIFKSSNVLLSTDENIAISARNKIKGRILKISQNNTNSEVIIDIGHEKNIVSIVTTGAVKKLALKEGAEVFAFIKSNDVMIGK